MKGVYAMVLAVVHGKGGVGATTTAVNLAAALAQRKRSVLLVDLDAQSGASLSLGVSRAHLSPSIADVLLRRIKTRHAIRSSGLECLDLLTASAELADVDSTLGAPHGSATRLRAAIRPVKRRYDAVVLDCPPGLSRLSVNALVAADAFIVPASPHYLSLEAIVGFFAAIDRRVAVPAGCLGILLTMVDRRSAAGAEIAGMMREHYQRLVFATEIPSSAGLAEAPSFGQSILTYRPVSPAARAYRRFAREMIARAAIKTESVKAGPA